MSKQDRVPGWIACCLTKSLVPACDGQAPPLTVLLMNGMKSLGLTFVKDFVRKNKMDICSVDPSSMSEDKRFLLSPLNRYPNFSLIWIS